MISNWIPASQVKHLLSFQSETASQRDMHYRHNIINCRGYWSDNWADQLGRSGVDPCIGSILHSNWIIQSSEWASGKPNGQTTWSKIWFLIDSIDREIEQNTHKVGGENYTNRCAHIPRKLQQHPEKAVPWLACSWDGGITVTIFQTFSSQQTMWPSN